MGVAYLTVDLRPRHECRHGVYNYDIYRAGSYHSIGDRHRLLAVVRLGDVEIVHIHADALGICRVKRMLRVNKSRDAASLLNLRHHMKSDRRLARRLRSVDLYDPALGDAADTQRQIKAHRAGRSGLHIHRRRVTQLHDRSLAVVLFDLRQSRLQCLFLIITAYLAHSCPP